MTDKDKNAIIELIKNGQKLPKELIYQLFADEEDVFLFWNGRKEEVTNLALPFHSIEHIDEPRKETQKQGTALDMFETDFRGRQLKGWTNKLIWGDNKLILSSLANGSIRQEIEAQGGLKLIYIDPPFAVGADFGFNIEIGGETAEKKQSIIEEIAYRDTWGKGISSYLSMMYERLKLMHNLLADDGSLYLHCDYRVVSYLRIMLNDIIGENQFQSEIIWKRTTARSGSSFYNNVTDNILFYTKNENAIWNQQYVEYDNDYVKTMFRGNDEKGQYRESPLTAPGKANGLSGKEWKGIDPGKIGKGRHWAIPGFVLNEISNEAKGNTIKSLEELDKIGRIIWSKNGMPNIKQYLKELSGVELQNIWTGIGVDKTDYPTQKPEALLERIIKASSNEGDLIADFFCGSGTTAAVAEKLGRKWITTDLGRFSVHTARKRLIGVQREMQSSGKDFRAFEVLNLGKYERQFFMNEIAPSPLERAGERTKEEAYVNLILEAYRAKRLASFPSGESQIGFLHGSKGGRLVHVGPLDVPVTQSLLKNIFEECKKNLYTQVDVLGFEFEMGLAPFYIQELRAQGLSINLKYIPKEVFDKRATDKGQAKFFDVAFLDAKVKYLPLPTAGAGVGSVTVELTDFVTHYTQDDIEDIQHSLKQGSKVVIEDGQIIKIEKDKDGILLRTLLTPNWYDWIDYWAIDFDYHSKKEMIHEEWTGNYIFENEWQSFRTKKNPSIEFTSAPHEYARAGNYKVMVKVVDILGIDTSRIVEVNIG